MSPGSSAARADRADENGAPASAVRNSSAHSAGNGMPGIAISPTVPIPSTSQAIMTWRPGNRSARPDSSGPPAIGGRYLTA